MTAEPVGTPRDCTRTEISSPMPPGSTSLKMRHFSASLPAKSKMPRLRQEEPLPHEPLRAQAFLLSGREQGVPVHVRGQVLRPGGDERIASPASARVTASVPSRRANG